MLRVLILVTALFFSLPAQADDHQSAFDRVMATNTLRCGYAVATPWFSVDPNTKAMSGVSFDVTNAVAAKLGVEVKWVEETDWGLAEQGLVAGRYDMMCGSVCVDPRRARAATYSKPFQHVPTLAVVKAEDHRFDAGLASLNDPAVRIGVKAGHVFEFITDELFPRAQKIYANSLSDDTEFFLMLDSNKIDVAFAGQVTVDMYDKQSPGKVRSLSDGVRYCNGAFMVPLGDERLKLMVDNALDELNTDGRLEAIFSRYMPLDPRYVRAPARPYKE